jgi:hypothetical protein
MKISVAEGCMELVIWSIRVICLGLVVFKANLYIYPLNAASKTTKSTQDSGAAYKITRFFQNVFIPVYLIHRNNRHFYDLIPLIPIFNNGLTI